VVTVPHGDGDSSGQNWVKLQQQSAGTELDRFFRQAQIHGYPFYDHLGQQLTTASAVLERGTADTFCPVHESTGSHDPSVAVTVLNGGNRVLTYCWPCGESTFSRFITGDVPDCTAVYRAGHDSSSSGSSNSGRSGGKLVAEIEAYQNDDYLFWWRMQQNEAGIDDRTYFYTAPDGTRFAKVRWSTADRNLKAFRWYRAFGEGGRTRWSRSLYGMTPPLYGAEWLKPDGPVFAVEGEKDTDRLISSGLAAVSSHCFVPRGGNPPDFSMLAGREVVVIPDNDETGDRIARTFARMAASAGARVRLSGPLGLLEGSKGYDASDYLDNGGTAGGLLELARQAAEVEQPVTEGGVSRLVTGAAFFLDIPKEIPANWGEGDMVLWAGGEGMMVASHQGLGKSALKHQLVFHRLGLRGPRFLGLPVSPARGKILSLEMDRPMQAARSGRRMVTDSDRAVLNERLVVWKGPLPISILTSPQAFADWAQEKCPGVSDIFIDSAKDLCPGISGDEVGAALNIAWQEVIAREIEMMILHHQRKAGSGTERLNTLDDVYGSTWLTSGLGSVVALAGTPGDSRVSLMHLKQPAEQVPEMMLEHDFQTGITRLVDRVQTVFEALRIGGPGTARDISLAVYATEPDRNMIDRVKRELERLIGLELVVRHPGTALGRGRGRSPDTFELVPGAEWKAG
jgi:hypothetical protein